MTNIKIVRDAAPRERDFKVLIDGEHRATFRSRKRYSMIGYDLEAPDGGPIYGKKFARDYTKAEFEQGIRDLLAHIPTRAQIDRSLLIDQAAKENRERDAAIGARRARISTETTRVALARYLTDPASPEHAAAAAATLRGMDLWESRSNK